MFEEQKLALHICLFADERPFQHFQYGDIRIPDITIVIALYLEVMAIWSPFRKILRFMMNDVTA